MKRLAVVPFHEMSGARDGDAFADGFAEAICGALARYPGVEVVPPASTRHVAREGVSPVAREFAADHVLSGSVQRAGDRLRVTCSLVDAAQGTQCYGEVFEGPREELFALEDQLVKALASALRLAPPSPQPERRTADPIAHEKLLQARGYLQRFDHEAAVDGAIRLLETLAHEGGAAASVWAELGRAYRHRYRHMVDRVWLERSLHACEQALALDPQEVRALSAKASANMLLGRLEEAEAGFREALRHRPDEMSARTGLMELYRRQGRLAESEAECRRGVALRPNDWIPWNLLGTTLFEMGRYEDAIDAWKQVMRLTPDNGRAHYNTGGALFRLGRLDEAEQAYREAIERHRSGVAFTGLGTVLFYKREMAAAEEAFEKAVGLRPKDPLMWGNLAAARRWLPGREDAASEAYAQAIALARAALETDPVDAGLMGNLAVWQACRGEFDEALARIRQALRIDPEGAHTHVRAVSVFELAGKRPDALALLERAVRLGYGWAEIELDPDLQGLRGSEEFKRLRLAGSAAPSRDGAMPLGIDRPQEGS